MARRIATFVSASLVTATVVTAVAASLALAQGDAPPHAPLPPSSSPSPKPPPPPPPPPNHPPVLETKALETNEDIELLGVLQAADLDGDKLTFKIAKPPVKVKLTLVDAKSGAFKIVPPPNWHGADSFLLDVSDGRARATGRVDVTVASMDDAPVLTPTLINATEDANARGQVRAVDVDGDVITYAIADEPANGVASIDATTGALMYIPQQDFAGDDAIGVTASSGPADRRLETRTTVKVKVVAVNDKPRVETFTVEGVEDTKLDATLSAKDVEGDALSFKLAAPPKKGRVTVVDKTGAFTFLPNKDENGADAFTIDVSDGKLKSTATVIVKLAPVDDAPAARPLALSAVEDASAQGRVTATDPDGDALTYAIATQPAHGSATVDAKSGAVTYTGAADYHGDDAFTVDVTSGAHKVIAPVSVTVAPVNDPPTAGDVSFSVDEDGKLDGALAGADKDGDQLTYRVAEPTKRGAVVVDAAKGTFVYRPAKDLHGDDAFTYEVSDGKLKATATAKASVKVNAVDDPPSAGALSLTTNEDTAARGKLVARDVDGDALAYAIARAPVNGTAVVDATGTVTFTPAANYAGGDAFSVEVSAAGAKATAEVSVKVAPVNDAPVASAGSAVVDEDGKLDGTLTAADPDSDGDKVTFKVTVPTKRGALAVDAATGVYVYRPAPDFHGTDSFTFEASDGRLRSAATVALDVKAVPDPPLAKPLVMAGSEDAPARGTVSARDGDGDAVRFALGTAPAHGSATVDATTGVVVYTPEADYWGKDELTVDVTSGTDAAKATATVSVTIAPVNDPPVARAVSFNGSEDEAIEGQLDAADAEKDPIAFKIAVPPKRGTVKIDERTGTLRYRPYSNLHGTDAFTFDASDGRMKSTGTVTLAVAPVNDAPVAKAMALATREDTPVRGTMFGSDVDGDKLTYAVAREPARGSVTVDAKSGAFTYTPAPDVHGEDTFTLSVSDGTASAEPVVKVTIASVPDLPRVREGAIVDVQEDATWTGTLPAASPDGGAITFRLGTAAPRLGSVVLLDAATGAVKYTPRADVNGDDELAFDVAPAGATTAAARVKGTLKVRVVAVNDAPVATALEIHGSEDTTAEAALAATDVDGDKLTFAIVTPPAVGQATIHDGKTLRYQPPKDHTGDVVLEVVAKDAAGAASMPVKVTAHVKPVNDAPLLSDLVVPPHAEDTPAEGAVVWSDVDDARLAFKILKKPTRGTVDLTDAGQGRFRYIPERNFSGPDSFVLVATDAGNAEGRATVRVVVTAVDDPPVAYAAQASAPRVGRFRGKLAGYDPEGSPITFAIERGPAFGRVELLDARTGEYLLITDGSGSGNTFFRFTVNDGKLTSAPSRVDITVR